MLRSERSDSASPWAGAHGEVGLLVCHEYRRGPRVIADRIRADHREMPGLSLTREQTARLLRRDCRLVMAALDELRGDAFLVQTLQWQFVRPALDQGTPGDRAAGGEQESPASGRVGHA